MNTIYDGSFVLGSTNELTFSAGPGIKIDQPSEGTVRIGNDETVLFDSYGDGQSEATLSEPMTNFEKIKVLLGNQNAADGLEWHEYVADPSKIKNIWYCAGGGSNFYFVCCYCESNTASKIKISKEVAIIKSFGNANAPTGQAQNSGYMPCIHKVIGINRISGGNE